MLDRLTHPSIRTLVATMPLIVGGPGQASDGQEKHVDTTYPVACSDPRTEGVLTLETAHSSATSAGHLVPDNLITNASITPLYLTSHADPRTDELRAALELAREELARAKARSTPLDRYIVLVQAWPVPDRPVPAGLDPLLPEWARRIRAPLEAQCNAIEQSERTLAQRLRTLDGGIVRGEGITAEGEIVRIDIYPRVRADGWLMKLHGRPGCADEIVVSDSEGNEVSRLSIPEALESLGANRFASPFRFAEVVPLIHDDLLVLLHASEGATLLKREQIAAILIGSNEPEAFSILFESYVGHLNGRDDTGLLEYTVSSALERSCSLYPNSIRERLTAIDPAIRRRAAELCYRNPTGELLEALLPLLEDSALPARAYAALALGNLHAPEARPVLEDLVMQHGALRQEAAVVLADLLGEAPSDALATLATATDEESRRIYRHMILRSRNSRYTLECSELLGQDATFDFAVRSMMAKALCGDDVAAGKLVLETLHAPSSYHDCMRRYSLEGELAELEQMKGTPFGAVLARSVANAAFSRPEQDALGLLVRARTHGIFFLSRIPPQLREEAVAFREQPYLDERPLAAVLIAQGDRNGYFRFSVERQLTALRHHFRVWYGELRREADLSREMELACESGAQRKPEQIRALIIGGHGDDDGTALPIDRSGRSGDEFHLAYEDRGSFAVLGRYMADGSNIILDSCSSAAGGSAGENLARALREALPHVACVAGPELPTRLEWILVRPGGDLFPLYNLVDSQVVHLHKEGTNHSVLELARPLGPVANTVTSTFQQFEPPRGVRILRKLGQFAWGRTR